MSKKVSNGIGKILIGADPELFAFDPGGIPVSVHDILPGSKHNPVLVPKGAIQVDGVAAEFNIDPADKRSTFLRNIKHVRGLLEKLLSMKAPDLYLDSIPTATFPEEYFASLPENVVMLGCEPDFNAYTGKTNPKPQTNKPFRTGGGHIHIGWTEGATGLDPSHFEMCCGLVRNLDATLYRSSKRWDKDESRRQLYGMPGSFRPKEYGCEYRPLSNAWLKTSTIQMYVYDCTRAVTELFMKGVDIPIEVEKAYGLEADKIPEKEYESFLQRLHVPTFSNYA